MSPWTQTRSGRAYFPLRPTPEMIDIEDIAHALSNLCRFGGHCRQFYSVAEHSVHVARALPPGLKLQGLMHDATEAYLVDVPKPLKPLLAGYDDLERRAWRAIAAKFDLPEDLHDLVHEADVAVLLAERVQLLETPPHPWVGYEHVRPAETGNLSCLPPTQARDLFLSNFRMLTT